MANLETVPAKAAPESGAMRDLIQERPKGILPAVDRARVAAFVQGNENWAGTILIAGEVSHWVQVSAGEIVSFQSFLTGRLAAALGTDQTLVEEALSDTMSKPERLAAHLRSAELTGNGALSHLIGAELAATRAYWLGADVRLIGEGALVEAYEAALKAQAAWVTRF